MPEEKRLFVAIAIPELLQELLVAIQHSCTIEGAKWTKPQNFHITLRFLGNIQEDRLPAIHAALNTIKHKAFTVIPSPVGTFNEKVLWVGVEKTGTLAKLKEEVDQTLETLGIVPELRPFQPHITLARLKTAHKAALQVFLEKNAQQTFPVFSAAHFILYESVSHEKGVEYHPLHYYPLSEQN